MYKASTPRFTMKKLLLCLFPLALHAASERPPEPWPGPKGEFVFLEAESFPGDGKAWQIVETPTSNLAEIASGMKALRGSGLGGASVKQQIAVAEEGNLRLWVRFIRSPEVDDKWHSPFRVSVEQSGRVAGEYTFDEKHVPSPAAGPRRSSNPPFVWEFFEVPLGKGAATVALTTVGKLKDAEARRVDCLLLTSDAVYKPDERDFAPQTYARIRVKRAVPERVYFYSFNDHMRAPWYRNVNFNRRGWADSVAAPPADYLGAGEETPWMNISRLLYTDTDSIFMIQATVKYHNPDATESEYDVDFATEPSEGRMVKTIHRAGPGAGLQVRVPPDLTAGRMPKADAEFAAERAAFIAKLTPPAFGKRPEKFPVMVGLNASDVHNTPSVRADETRAMQFLGINGRSGLLTEDDVRAGLIFGSAHASIWHMGPARFNEPLLDKIEAGVKQAAVEFSRSPRHDQAVHTLLMDEAGAKDLKAMVGDAVDERRFREWLRENGHTPASLGVASWEAAGLTADPGAPTPALYYLSQRFRAWSVAEFFRLATEQVRKHFPASAPATQNYSDGAVYQANLYAQGNDYFTWFSRGALDAAMSEDWTNGGATPEDCGWNVALLRAATRRHGQPIHMYVISSFGRRPLDVKLKALTDISEGAKALHFYAYSPRYAGHEHGWAENFAMFPAIAEVTREIGAAEDVLLDAMPRRAETAILYSTAYDIWNVGLDNTQGFERMHTWLALRHAQVPVDVISDEDAREGQLDGRKVVYLHGEQLDARNVAPLAAWVRAGGTLVLGPEAGSRDELNRPNTALDDALGLHRAPGKVLQKIWHSGAYVCKLLKTQGQVSLGGESVDFVARSQPVEAIAGGEVWARFEDGTPAAALQPVEHGRVALWGFLPALAYIRTAYLHNQEVRDTEPATPLASVARAAALLADEGGFAEATGNAASLAKVFAGPIHYSAPLRALVTQPTRVAKVARPVELSTAEVEANFLEGTRGWVVPLANYTGAPLQNVSVIVRPGRPFGEIRSSRRGALQRVENKDGSVTVTLPLESTDFVFAEWKR